MKIFVALLVFVLATVLVRSQDRIVIPGEPVERPKDLPALHDWSARLPEIEQCTKWNSAISEAKAANPQWILEYKYSHVRYDWLSSRIQDSCARLQVEFTYRFIPPPAPKLTKEQLREQKRLEELEKNARKKLEKINDLFTSMVTEPTPRSFTLRGYPATEYFQTGCDTPPCPLHTRISVKFAKDRILHIDGERTLDEVVAILNSVDFEALNAEISRWIRTKGTSGKTKGLPVSEKPSDK